MIHINRKKVVFFMNSLSGYGGSKKTTISLVNKLSNTYEIKLISLFQTSEPSYDINSNISVVVLYDKILNIYELTTYKKMLRKLQIGKICKLFIDLIYIIFNFPQAQKKILDSIKDVDTIAIPEIYGILYIPQKYLKSKKIIMQIHTSYEFIKQNFFIYSILKIYKKYINTIIVLTDADKNRFDKDGFKHVNRIYNSIELKDNLLERNINGSIVFVGRLDVVKGGDYISDIAKEVIGKKEACFEIYGEGPLEKKIRDDINNYGIGNSVILKGSTDNVYSVLKNAACLIAPSRHEGLPMIFLEALSCGVPIVSFRSFEGINEVIEDNVNGFVVEMEDIRGMANKIVKLLNNVKLNEELGKNGLETVQKFRIENIIEQWMEIL